MDNYDPTKSRYSLNDKSGISIIIPVRQRWNSLVYLLLWLAAGFGEIIFEKILLVALMDTPGSGGLLLSYFLGGIWLIGWLIVGIMISNSLTWLWTGPEELEITQQSVRIRKLIFGYGKWAEYSAEYILNLQLNNHAKDAKLPFFCWKPNGSLAFESLGRTVTFGDSMDPADARHLLLEIYQRYPQYEPHLEE